MLFAQAAGGGPNPNVLWGLVALFAALGVFCLGALIVFIFFLRTLSRAIERCHPDNRTMSPGLVWINLIGILCPCFVLIWGIITVVRVSDSLKAEFEDRRLDEGGDYGKTIGLACILLGAAGYVIQNVGQFAVQNNQQMAMAALGVSGLLNLADLVLFILYWVRVAGFSRQLADDEEEHGALADDDEDDYDDEPETPAPTDRPPPLPPVDPPHDPPR